MKDRFAVDIAVDPANRDVQPIGKGLACDTICKETFANGGVQQNHHTDDQQ